jgi:cleavage and polyadenylation specificity factor subunit 3
VILVHGEKHNMGRLKSRLLSLNKFKVFNPQNCEEVRIPFRREKIARVVGRLASQVQPSMLLPSPPADEDEEGEGDAKRLREEGQVVSGVLVQNDFKLSLMAPEDLREYAGLTTTTIRCRQRLHLAAAGVELIRWALEGTFGTVTVVSDERMNGVVNGTKKGEDADEEIKRQGETIFEVMGGAVRLIHHPNGEVEIEWEGNAANDGIADAVMAVLLTIESSPASVKQSSKMHNHNHAHDDKRKSVDYDAFGDSPVATRAPNGGFEAVLAERNDAPGKNPFANVSPAEKLSRLFMFLEAQFGEDATTPIAQPKLPALNGSAEDSDEVENEKAEAAELARLHALGIPVPGVEIKVDNRIVKVWLEDLEVECSNKTLGDRVRAVVERAVETIAPLWQ